MNPEEKLGIKVPTKDYENFNSRDIQELSQVCMMERIRNIVKESFQG
jgi:hypothetical protein